MITLKSRPSGSCWRAARGREVCVVGVGGGQPPRRASRATPPWLRRGEKDARPGYRCFAPLFAATPPAACAPVLVKEGRGSAGLWRNPGRLSMLRFLPLSGCERSARAVVGLLMMLFCSRRPVVRRARVVDAERVRS